MTSWSESDCLTRARELPAIPAGGAHCIFDEVVTEAVALRLSFDLWRDVIPCWMGRVRKEVKLSPVEALNARVWRTDDSGRVCRVE